MAPKSSDKKASDSAPPSSRRSGRLAGSAPQVVPEKEEPKKRPTSGADGPASVKKAKPDSTSKPAQIASKPKSKTTGNGKAASSKAKAKEAIPEEAAEKEKEAEAPADAEPETDGKALKEGDKLPSITLKDEEGQDVEIGKLAGDKGVVLFLYPKANTPGCTNQACGFRDAFDDISALGYEVYGLSRDGPTAQKNWKTKQKLNYKLLCDPDSVLIKKLGAFVEPKNTKRSHFIFEKGSGKLVEAKYGVKPADDPANCLKVIKAHH